MTNGRTQLRRLLLAVALLAGCATAGRVLPSAEELAARSGADPAALARGRAAWVRECGTCHRQYWPDERSAGEWSRIAPEMAERAGLSDSLGRDLTLFLTVASGGS